MSKLSEPNLEMVARALRLVGEVRDLVRGSVEQRTHFLRGMAEMLGGQVALWVRIDNMNAGAPNLVEAVDVGWESEAHRQIFLDYFKTQDAAPDPTLPQIAQIEESLWTRTRQQLADDRTWYHSQHVQELRRQANTNSCIIGARRRGDLADAFSIHRPWGDRPFTERDARLAEILYQEAAPLLLEPAMPRLSPRLKAVLEGLCNGQSEKQIAGELDLSPHTVHDYAKELHRRFGAQSRGELLAKVLNGMR